MEPEGSLPSSQDPSAGPYPKPDQAIAAEGRSHCRELSRWKR
jgi:hypothetical protein